MPTPYQPTGTSGIGPFANLKGYGADLASQPKSRPPLSSFMGKRPPLTSFLKRKIPGSVSAAANSMPKSFFGNMVLGAGKGMLSTADTLGQGALSLYTKIPFVPGKKTAQQAIQEGQTLKDTALSPQNTAQTIGKTGEQIGEYFIPGGAEKSLAEMGGKLASKIPEALNLGEKAGNVITGAGKIAAGAAASAASGAGVTAAQGGNLGQIKTAAESFGALGALGKTFEVLKPSVFRSMAKAGFKMSPAAEAKAASKMQSAAKFMQENGIGGKLFGNDEAKYQKLFKITTSLESALQSSLPKNVMLFKSSVIDSMKESMKEVEKTDLANYPQVKKQVERAIQSLMERNKKYGTMSVGEALADKRSFAARAFNTNKFKVIDPRVVSEGDYIAELSFQEAINKTLDTYGLNSIKIPKNLSSLFGGKSETTLNDFNKVYSNAITARNLTNTARFKNDSGLVGTMLGIFLGKMGAQAVGLGPLGEMVGMGLGDILSKKSPGVIRGAIEKATKKGSGKLTGTISKAALGAFNRPNP
ncbi:MAG: hypothetical protein KGL39_35285 [Patescibacteria group bacterium]|nr:hypothetical protein [Patescibacteria group bacterium]